MPMGPFGSEKLSGFGTFVTRSMLLAATAASW